MSGLSGILEIGRRALSAHQAALNITAHNMANINTEGYTRQKPVLIATSPGSNAFGQFGTGVEIDRVQRLRNEFLDSQIRKENEGLGNWTYSAQVLSEIETLIAEPSDTGLSSLFSAFWNSWQDLTDDPKSGSARTVVRQSGKTLAAGLNHLDAQMREMRRSLDADLVAKVSEVNNIVSQVAGLNGQIATIEMGGDRANDYRDQRDHLVDQLHKLLNIEESEDRTGMYTLTLSGNILLAGQGASELDTRYISDGEEQILGVIWKDEGRVADISSGEIGGLQRARDVTIPEYQDRLDTLAAALVEHVNETHSEGYDLNGDAGGAFFSGAGAGDIAVFSAILDDTDAIAASSDGSPGDNGNALAIAQLRHQPVMEEGSLTFGDQYAAMVGILGVEAREATHMRDNQEQLIAGLESHRQALSGVSLDEELTYLIEYQHAYQAAARVISATDELMRSVLDLL